MFAKLQSKIGQFMAREAEARQFVIPSFWITDIYSCEGVGVQMQVGALVLLPKKEWWQRQTAVSAPPTTAQTAFAKDVLESAVRTVLSETPIQALYFARASWQQTVSERCVQYAVPISRLNVLTIRDEIDYLEDVQRLWRARWQCKLELATAAEHETRMVAQYDTAGRMVQAERDFLCKQAAFHGEVASAQAEADLAYAHRYFQVKQAVAFAKGTVDLVAKQRETAVAAAEVKRAELALAAAVKKPAAAERYRVEALAQAEGARIERVGRAAAAVIRQRGIATATAMRAKGMATADTIRAQTAVKAQPDAAIETLLINGVS